MAHLYPNRPVTHQPASLTQQPKLGATPPDREGSRGSIFSQASSLLPDIRARATALQSKLGSRGDGTGDGGGGQRRDTAGRINNAAIVYNSISNNINYNTTIYNE